jgi:hypothetical protein
MLFTFVGDWRQLRIADPLALKGDIEAVAAHQFPRGDEQAPLRILARERLTQAAELARDGGAVSMFVLGEIARGVPLPAIMTVFAPDELTIAPSVGTAPEAVMRAFAEARSALGIDGAEWYEFSTTQSLVSRTVTTTTVDVNQATSDVVEAPMLEVNYWMTIPGTKRLLQIGVQTPVAHAPAIATRYFDRTVAGIHFVA